ncbi:MAG: mannonate dehydratase [Anaerolineae bacterium]|nr:mannonate dehydratase [Anaerolineae bacterium]
MAYFYERIVPVAEEAKVRLATHPDDPPMVYYRGVHQALINFEGLKRLVGIHPGVDAGVGDIGRQDDGGKVSRDACAGNP